MFKFNKGKKKLGQHLSGKGFSVNVPTTTSSTQSATSTSSSSTTTTTNTQSSNANDGAQWSSIEELHERVPGLVSKFVSLLGSNEDGHETRGLFRVVPEKVRDQLKSLRAALNASVESGAGVDSVDIGKVCSSVHAAAHAFKRYLQSLPEPLFSYALYDSFILTHSIVDQEEKLNELRRLLKQLPVGYKETAKTLLHFFYLVIRSSAKNGVTFDRFANMFGPTFLRAEDHVYYMQNDAVAIASILKLMLDNNQSLFRMTVGLAAQRRRTIRRPASLALVGPNSTTTTTTTASVVSSSSTPGAVAAAAAAQQDGSVGVSRVIMRANTVDTLAPIAPAGSNAARAFYPPSMTDDEVQRAMKAEQRRTASSLVKMPSPTSGNSPEASPPPRKDTEKSWQAAMVSPSPINTPPVPPAVAATTAAAPAAPADASADGSSGDDARSSGRVRRGSDVVQRRRHRTGTRGSAPSDGTPSADASEESSPRLRSSRSAHRDPHRRTNSTTEETVTTPAADDPLGVANASTSGVAAAAAAAGAAAAGAATSSTSAHGDSVAVTISHAGKPLSITLLQRDTLESVLDALSKAAGTTIADVKVVSSADGTQVGLLSQSSEGPFATHFGMHDEGLQFSYETVPRKKLRKKRTLTSGNGEDETQARIATLLRGIKTSIEQAALFSDAITLSTAVRDTLKLVNNAVKQTGADIDTLREFKNAHPRTPLERVAPPTGDEQLALELNNLLDIVLPLMDQLLDLCAYLPAAPETNGVDVDDVLAKVDEILAGASVV
jgi:hypothetical protein